MMCLSAVFVMWYIEEAEYACMHVAQVREQLTVLQAACKAVQGSQLFIQLLQAVLSVGNYLNQGTFKGNAPGPHLHTHMHMHAHTNAAAMLLSI